MGRREPRPPRDGEAERAQGHGRSTVEDLALTTRRRTWQQGSCGGKGAFVFNDFLIDDFTAIEEKKDQLGHSNRVKCLAVAPGEREYVSCSNDDSIMTYFDIRTTQELGIFSGHQDTVIHALFSPCGKFLATNFSR